MGAELLQGMAHMALDFSGFVTPSRHIIRACAVVGRLCCLSADYLPDHSIHPEEFAIQVLLMGIALRDYWKKDSDDEAPAPARRFGWSSLFRPSEEKVRT